ncbi:MULTISPECIES: hypothetical protein [unclassified Novosphingobium]|uniref:hypothetical protein n=1 Tax=unclassified Novosphingobium TaxID=2644732 RepID=UPI000D31D238|nr:MULTISPECIES: hypothetical protein [unclassified Novosphingobium]PTR11759.1 hypothetical protein C8K11_104118 [Novosphingobium sp. GV055]PUB04799.1 hypothetical protein C8K12_104118 [Novosphingobium sp. GV061]PUB21118.1 hypothetical protein C8K14_104118 [Novosphingobium sp. GV079]PUB42844.1 hypothetical protein C8K10_104118 [Novosphingobium sp. GV027]
MDTPDSPEIPADDAASNEPLLNLNTLIVRPIIAIDGQRFEIMSPDELSILDGQRFGIWGRRINALAESDDDTADQEELEQLVDKVARKVAVGVPDDVFAKLSGANKQSIADVFTGLLLRNRLGVAGAIAKAAGVPLSTGAKSSPSSSGSMVASHNGGWLKRLLRWFAHS